MSKNAEVLLENLDSAEVTLMLQKAAREASKNSYSPYSNFKVGAAILMGSGEIYTGCNIENASYGLTSCGERTAIFKAISRGEREIKAVVVYTPTPEACPPCGACRQVINEFGPDAKVICICDSDSKVVTSIKELLPGAFGPKNLLSIK